MYIPYDNMLGEHKNENKKDAIGLLNLIQINSKIFLFSKTFSLW